MKRNSFIFTSLLILVACSVHKGEKTAPDFSSVEQKVWTVESINKEPIEVSEPDRKPNLLFKDGRASGYASCNRISCSYTVEGQSITLGHTMMTKMFCHDYQKLENSYATALANVKKWELKKGKLLLKDEQDQILIIFKEATASK